MAFKAEASIWKLAVAVTGLGVTMGVILLVLGLLTFKRRSGEGTYESIQLFMFMFFRDRICLSTKNKIILPLKV